MQDDENLRSTPEEISAAAQSVTDNLLPAKSRRQYDKSYEKFMAWRLEHHTTSFSENVLLAYFKGLGEQFKPSSLWVEYSKLKSTLNIYHQTDISKYAKLLALLKRKSEGFKAKKAKTFSPEDLKKFIEEAPDHNNLFEKVAVISGIMGACRRQELHDLKYDNILDAQETLVIHIMNTKNRIDRTFTVTGKYYHICKKYINLRPDNCNTQNFFVRYAKGKCFPQNIGINTFGQLGKSVASYLGLPNPELYTGHCFRRTSATLLVDAGGDVTSLKRHGGWKSTTVAESYIDNSIESKKIVSNKIMNSIEETTRPVVPEYTYIPDHQSSPTFTPDPDFVNTTNSSIPVPTTTPLTISQIIEQNSDIHINHNSSNTSTVPNINISNNTITNLHLHFHK